MGEIHQTGNEAHMVLYCDTLVLFLLVESTLGECNLHRELSDALDELDPLKMVACKRRFDALPAELKDRVLEGDLSLPEETHAPPESIAEEADDSGRKTA